MTTNPTYHVKETTIAVKMFDDEFGLLPYCRCKGPNNSDLLFYGFRRNVVIVQIFPHAGWDVYVNGASNRVDDTMEMLRALQADLTL